MNHPNVLLEEYCISHLSGYHTKTRAQYFFQLKSPWDIPHLHEIYQFSISNKLPLLIISGGTNLLFVYEFFPWIIIENSLMWWSYDESKKILHSYSRESIWKIAETLENEYDNPLWHRFIWLPGSIGGAVYGNAWCFGLETESNFQSATVYDMTTWEQKILRKEDMWFAYRHSVLKERKEYFLIGAEFDLSEKHEKYHSDVDNIYFREHKQPKGYCCGSFFKNPSKETSAWFLIESVWLKWYHHGGAYWSDLHANFLMSDGLTCTGQDLIELVRMTQEKVKKEKWIDLVNEVQIIE